MKKKNRNRKLIFSSTCISCPLQFDVKISSNNLEKLISHKLSLELLLSEIKTSEIAVLFNSDESINKNILSILLDLKKELNIMHEEKKAKLNKLKDEITNKKVILQKQLFNVNKNEPSKNPKENIENDKKITNTKYNINSELSLLKTLDFMAENYINQIDSIILKKTNDYNYLKLCMEYTSVEEKEIICLEPKYEPLITKILHKEIFDKRKKFKLVVSAKQYQNDELENTKQNLAQLKNFIEKKKNGYVDNKEIIPEESKEFTQSITLNRMNNNINNLMNIYNKQKQMEDIYNDNIIIIDNLDDESFNSNAKSNSSKNENKDADINNKISKLINLNMNINFNVNFDKFFGNNYLLYNSERTNNDILNLLNTNKKKKGLSSTGSLPNIMNSIRDDSVEVSINDQSKNKISEANNICKYINNSRENLNKN